jgi:hypothetical protein
MDIEIFFYFVTGRGDPFTYMSRKAVIGCGISGAKECPMDARGCQKRPWQSKYMYLYQYGTDWGADWSVLELMIRAVDLCILFGFDSSWFLTILLRNSLRPERNYPAYSVLFH